MPKRPRSHQLEDISINKFQSLLPAQWVIRHKNKDYGIDLEVEIFEETSEATGLMLLVQIRATDKVEHSRKLSLTFDQLCYFNSIDLPVLIIRYCSEGESFFCQWDFNIFTASSPRKNQKSFTYTFVENELWTDKTPESIKRTLETQRLVKRYPPSARIVLQHDTSLLSSQDRFVAEKAISNAVTDAFKVLAHPGSFDAAFAINVIAQPTLLQVGIDCFASIQIVVESYETEQITTTLLYSITALLSNIRLTHQAERLSYSILARGKSHYSRYLGYVASVSIATDLSKSVSLAVLNGIHGIHDHIYANYLDFIITSAGGDAHGNEAVMDFYTNALEAAHNIHYNAEASVLYSIGNFIGLKRKFADALQAFNRARKLRPDYLNQDYFLHELGACLFSAGHYRCATKLYERAVRHNEGPIYRLHLGDALLFSGQIIEARHSYDAVCISASHILSAEADLKLRLCDWLTDYVGASDLPVRRKEARALTAEMSDGGPELWHQIITTVDSMDEFAHFNLAVHYAREGLHDKALGGFLITAFKSSSDVDAWANAVISAFCCQDHILAIQIMCVSLSLAGRGSYYRLRDLLVEQLADEHVIERLDEVFRELSLSVELEHARDPTTVRRLTDKSFDVAHTQG